MKKIAFILVAVAALAAIMLIHNAHAYSNSYGTISYNSGTNTITITGNSSDGDAWSFYDIWHWCNVDPSGNASLVISPDSDATHEGTQYYFAAKLQIGDGTTPTWFEDTNKQITFDVSTTNFIFDITANAHATFGSLLDESLHKTTSGCQFIIYTAANKATYIRGLSGSEVNFYSCSFIGGLYYVNLQLIGSESSYDRVWNCYSTYNVQLFGGNYVDVYNLVNTDTALGLNRMQNTNVDRFTVVGGVSAVKFWVYPGTVSNIYTRGTYAIAWMREITSDDCHLLNPDTDTWKVCWEVVTTPSTKNLTIDFTFNPVIIDKNGDPVTGASVKLYDCDGNLIFEDTTDATGRLLQSHNVTYAVYLPRNVTTTVTAPDIIYAPFHLVITKAAYATYEANITIDHPFIDTPFVLDALTYTYDDIMALLQEKWGGYNASQFMQYLQQIDANITQVYQLLQLVNGNLTDVMNLLEMVDGNVTAIYNLLKQVDANITSISSKLDIINTTVHNNYALLQEINVTTHATLNRWANLTTTELYNLEKQTRDIAYYINSTRWAGYNFSSIMNKWGSHSASILYDVSNQAKEIADYINSTRWNTFVAEQLYNISNQAYQAANDAKSKWGSYTASDLYSISQNILSISQEIKSIVIHINTTISNGFRVELTDFGRLQAGKTYHAQILVFNENGSMIDADVPPTIELYDPVGNKITTDTMTHEEEGRYTYDFTTATTHPGGTWTTIVTTTVNGKEVKNIDYWELITNPAKITVDVVDDVIPDITAKLTITNEGNTSQEYTYYYWITPRPDGEIGDNDTIDSGSASKLIQPGETFETYVTLTCENEGDYYFRARVYYGTEYSDAYQLFTAASSGGGGWVITGNEFIKYMWYFITIIIFMFIVAIIAVLKAKSRKTRRRRR